MLSLSFFLSESRHFDVENGAHAFGKKKISQTGFILMSKSFL